MIIRLSNKLASKLHEGRLSSSSLDENPYADWSAHLFTADRTQYVIVSNTKTLYSVVMYGKGIADGGRFIERALSALREFMEYDGLDFVYERLVAPTSERVRFAKMLNRSVIGSITEQIKIATCFLEDDEVSPFELGFRLNGLLMSGAKIEKGDYGTPNEAFRALGG